MLMLGMITLLRIAANFYFGKAVTRIECSFTWNKDCPCLARCSQQRSAVPLFPMCHTDSGCQGNYWGFCYLLPLESCAAPISPFFSHFQRFRLAEMAERQASQSPDESLYSAYAFDFTCLVDFLVRPLISALGVYVLLRRADRFAAQSQLHVWSYRSVLWLFLASVLLDASISEALNWYSLGATGVGWSPFQLILFAIATCVSTLLQMLIGNMKLLCLAWKRLAAFIKLFGAVLCIAVIGFGVQCLRSAICNSGYYRETVSKVPGINRLDKACSYLYTFSGDTSEMPYYWWAVASISMGCMVGPLQSFGMWCTAIKAARGMDDELRWEIRFLYASAFCTMTGTPFTASILLYLIQLWNPNQFVQLMLTLDLSLQILNSLILGGMIGPEKWRKPLDMFKELELNGGLAANRIAFPGKINLSADDCIVSFPGIYSQEWDTAVAVASEQQTCSLACVFLTNVASGLGQHVGNRDSPGNCYCKALYGSVPLEAYLSEVDLSNSEVAIDQQQLAFKRADAKAMGQLLLIRHSHTTLLEWKEAKAAARRAAYKLWQENEGRAPWGCAWFDIWKQNVKQAVEKNQSLHVFYFEGRVGAGKVSWDELADEEARKNAREGGGLGNSQTAEVAYLDKQGLTYLEHDVVDFKAFIQASSVAIPEQVERDKDKFDVDILSHLSI